MKKLMRGAAVYIVPLLVFALVIGYFGRNYAEVKTLNFKEYIDAVQSDQIKSLERVGSEMQGVFKDDKPFKTHVPRDFQTYVYDEYLKDKVESKAFSYTMKPEPKTPFYVELLPTFLLLIGLVVVWIFFMNQTQGGNSKVMTFGKSRAKLHKDNTKKVTFDEVAGLKEEKEELMEIVDFLKNPKKYEELGARIPKGVLLVGQPGTGKTYLSRAVAGEAGVPFYSISGSDFVEMFVGVGASRVRDLFREAKKSAPCIIFIDEIDAVGRRRGAGMGGGHDEREQTLNQLLVEMDGFGVNEGIIVMAATNRADILDPAILRPGRFDRQVYVGLPDVREREAILLVHTRNKKLDPDVDLKAIARTTSGYSPADLENLTNEAALLAARYNLRSIPKRIFEEAAIKVMAGPEKKSAVVVEKERVLTAYHEAGHAIVSRSLPDMDPVHMITIVPRGMAGGFTAYIPEEDRKYMTRNGMKHRLIALLGGRAAEAVVLDDISTGASNDIERATKTARAMVTRYGFSEKLGPIAYGSDEEEVFMGRDFGRTKNYSEEVASEIDEEIRGLIDEAYHKALKILEENIDLLHVLAKTLLDKETIDADEFEAIYRENHSGAEAPEELQHVKERDSQMEKTIETGTLPGREE